MGTKSSDITDDLSEMMPSKSERLQIRAKERKRTRRKKLTNHLGGMGDFLSAMSLQPSAPRLPRAPRKGDGPPKRKPPLAPPKVEDELPKVGTLPEKDAPDGQAWWTETGSAPLQAR